MKRRAITGEGFKDHYLRQIGHGLPAFSGGSMQRGYGMGNILRGLFKFALPIAKMVGKKTLRSGMPILKKVGKKALKRGFDVAVKEMTNPKQPRASQIIGSTLKHVAKKTRRKTPKPKREDIFTPYK